MRALANGGIMPEVIRLDLLFAAAAERIASNDEKLSAYRSAVGAGLLPPMTQGGAR